jgi:hypothetical protein
MTITTTAAKQQLGHLGAHKIPIHMQPTSTAQRECVGTATPWVHQDGAASSPDANRVRPDNRSSHQRSRLQAVRDAVLCGVCDGSRGLIFVQPQPGPPINQPATHQPATHQPATHQPATLLLLRGDEAGRGPFQPFELQPLAACSTKTQRTNTCSPHQTVGVPPRTLSPWRSMAHHTAVNHTG